MPGSFLRKKQYLKSLILLYEGLIIAIGRKYGLDSGLNHERNQKIREYIYKNKKNIFEDQERIDSYYNLENTRNAAVHGSRSRGTQNYLEQEDKFEILFNSGIEIYEYMVVLTRV